MKQYILFIISALISVCAQAQNDPVILKIHNKNILRSEFEYSLNKHGKQKEDNIDDFMNDFINRKLLSEAAKEKGLDTTSDFKRIYNYYKNKLTWDSSLSAKGRSIENAIDNPGRKYVFPKYS